MKKMMLLFSMLVVFQLAIYAQPYAPYISAERGDTLVVLDDNGYGLNSLYLCMSSDTVNVPAGRVYMLKNYGTYSLQNNPTSSDSQKVVVMGESNESIKTSQRAEFPPVISGAVWEGGKSIGNLVSGHDLLVKNVQANAGNAAGDLGWTMWGTSAGAKITIENSICEHNQWVEINPGSGSKIIFKNDYIVNLVGHSCRRNGGVIDFFSNQDTIMVENCTILQAQGSLFKFRSNYQVNRSIFNHNTFVNCAGYAFMNIGNTGNITVTNNIFVNCNVQAYCPVFQTADAGEVDKRDLPMGIVNVVNDSAAVANGFTFYVDRNLVYWDPKFDSYVQYLKDNTVNGTTDWFSQRITMNDASQAMFDDDETYPLLTEGSWVTGVMPNFTETADLMTDQVDNLLAYVKATVDTASAEVLPNWRKADNNPTDNFVYADWPIPVDLSYDNAELLNAGLGNYPLGDLDWFPTQKANWEMTKDLEYADINSALTTGIITGVEGQANVVNKFELAQNYPNPFNPTTVISYTIPEASEVTLKVYDVLGKEVATLVNGFQAANSYKVNFNAASLSTGVYIYKIEAGNFSMTKKMLLLK